jgi:hypothetical protein
MIKTLLHQKKIFVLILLLAFSINGSKAQNKEKTLHDLNNLLINTVMTDGFSPVVASRVYVYPSIAFYECIRHDDPDLPTLAGKLNGLKWSPAPQPQQGKKVDNFIAACISFSHVAQTLVGSEYKFSDWRKHFADSLFATGDSVVAQNSILFGRSVADSIIAWSRRDNYGQTRAMARYTYSSGAGAWQPTPLDYAQALEPHWSKMRPLAMSSASQFSPKEKLVYSASKNSIFYKTVMEVYNIGKNLDTNQKAIALYWDDNPSVSVNIGHLNYFIHKVSPGGHWIMIGQQVCKQKNIPVTKAAQVYALTAIAVYDGFISCWDEKFKGNLIRPITIINRIIDKNWVPYIQTPPFPEFTSGHSVISDAAAVVLTGLLGENFEFTDEIEMQFGNKARTFKSFLDAAIESTYSRVYGGIHYPETARISIKQGKDIGNHVLKVLAPSAATKQF